jgi:hypothetical protein
MRSSAGADAALSWRSRPALLLLLGLLGLALVAGVVARWHTLADRPLAVDEYYMVRSTEFILERGVPSFPSGGYYTRGLPLQYFMAGAVNLFGSTHLSYRLPTFFFSIFSIVLAYRYARRFTPAPVSLAVALALLVSSWHIEFAGFARMYALFQCIVLLFLIAVDDAFFSGNWRRRYLPHGLAVLASLTHAIGITLIPMLFLPLVAGGPSGGFRNWSERLRFGTAGLVTGLVCLSLIRGDFRVAGVENPLPAGYTGSAGSAFHLPVFPFWSLAGDPLTSMLLVSGLAVFALGLIWLFKRRELAAVDVWLVALMATSVAHLFVLAAIAFLVLLFRYDLLEPRRHSRRVYFMLAIAVLGGVAWLGYSIAFPEALRSAAAGRWDLSEAGFLKSLWTVFFGWPDIYLYTLRPFVAEMPLMGLLVVIASAIVLLGHRHDPLSSLLRQPWVILAVTLMLYGVVNTEYSRLRYWYHLYPVMLCMIALAITLVVSQLARRRPLLETRAHDLAAFAFIGLFALTSDFDPQHIARMGDDRVTFRTAQFEDRSPTWYQRVDFMSPAEFVNRQRPDEKARVVVEYHAPASYYLEGPHAIYIPREWQDIYPLHSRERGTLDAWSGQPLLDTPEELDAYTAMARDVWLIRGTDRARPGLPEPQATWGGRLQYVSRAFLSRDGRIEVLHITLSRNGPGSPDASPPQVPKSSMAR